MPPTIVDTMARGARAMVTMNGSEWGANNIVTTRRSARSGDLALVGNRSATYEALYRTQPWVRAAVDVVTFGVGRTPWAAYVDADTEGERTRQRQGPLADLLEEPYEGATPTLLKQAIAKNLMIHDNAIVVQRFGGFGQPPVELLPSSYGYWTILEDDNGRVDYYVFNGSIGNRPVKLPFLPSEVLHFHFWGTSKSNSGDSRMEALRTTLMVEDATQRMVIAAFEHGMRPVGGYSVDGQLKKETAERLRAQLNEVYGGVENAFKVMLLEGGAKWQDMATNFVDAELRNIRLLNRDEVGAVLGVPAPIMGNLEKATFSNITEQHMMLYQDVLPNTTVVIEETLRTQMIKRQPTMRGQYVEFNFKAMLKGDPVKEIEAGVKAVGGPYMTVDEFRATQNMPPLPNGQGNRLNAAPNTAGSPAPTGAGAA